MSSGVERLSHAELRRHHASQRTAANEVLTSALADLQRQVGEAHDVARRACAESDAIETAEIERREVAAKSAALAELSELIAEIRRDGAHAARAAVVQLGAAVRDLATRWQHALGRELSGRDFAVVLADGVITERPELCELFTRGDAFSSSAFDSGGSLLWSANRFVTACTSGAAASELQDAFAAVESALDGKIKTARLYGDSTAAEKWRVISRGASREAIAAELQSITNAEANARRAAEFEARRQPSIEGQRSLIANRAADRGR